MSPRKARGGSPGIFSLLAAARDYRAGGPGPKATLLALMERMGVVDGEWCCWPTTDELAFDTEQSAGTVRRHLARFEAAGLLDRRIQALPTGGRGATVLVLNRAMLGLGQSTNVRVGQGEPTRTHGIANAQIADLHCITNTQVTTKGGASAPPGTPSVAVVATQIVRAWWDERKTAGNPVGQPFIACTKVVATMLGQGVAANRIEWALRAAPVCSTGALEFAIQHRLAKGGRGGGDPVALAAEVREQLLRQEAGQ